MQSTPRVLLGLLVLVVAGTPAAVGGEATGIESTGPEVTEELAPDMLRLSPSISWRRAVLKMAGPAGFSLSKEFDPGEVIAGDLRGASGSDPADGRYRYELRLLLPRAERPEAPAEHVSTGLFCVENGQAVSRNATREEPASVEAEMNKERAGAAAKPPTEPFTVLEDVLRIEDTDGDGVAIALDAGHEVIISVNPPGDPIESPFHMFGPGGNYMTVESGDLMLGGTQTFNEIVAQAEVTMELPMKSLLSAPQIGIGTFMPEAELHIFPPLVPGFPNDTRTPTIRMHTFVEGPVGQSMRDWEIEANTGSFYLRDVSAGTRPLVVKSNSPDSSIVIADGAVDFGGDLNLPAGEVTADGLRLASSRKRKTGFEQVDPEQVLARLRDVPVSEWSFRGDENSVRHIGPVAEEFHAAFDLEGQDPTHLSVTDVQGVALAAIQGLDHKLGAREDEVARLREEIEGLGHANAELARRLVALEEGSRYARPATASPH